MFPVQSAQQWSLYDFEWAVCRLYCQLCSGFTITAVALAFDLTALIAAFSLAAAALALTRPSERDVAIHLRTNPRHVGGWARRVPVSRRRSRKHSQRRGECRCAGHHR